jgi:hypothetical protein
MRLKSFLPAVVAVASMAGCVANASAQVSLQEQLVAQYKLSKLGNDSTGTSVIDEGTVLTIQKGGVMGLPYKSMIWPNNTYGLDGTVKASAAQTSGTGTALNVKNKFCGLMKKCDTADSKKDTVAGTETSTKYFKKGDQVYVTKIEVKPDVDTVALSIVACESCNQDKKSNKKSDDQNSDKSDPTYNKAKIVFQLAKGTVAAGNAGPVEDTIGQLLAIKTDDAKSQGDQQQSGDQQQAQGGDQQQAAADAPAAEPAEVKVGMTPVQVESALGKPDKKVTLTSKTTYYYKDMKVIFVNGKVSDVQ